MDIYQIWTTYNPMWSEREIICFLVLMILVMAMVIQGIQKKTWNPIQGTAIVVLVLFLGIVFGSTVFTRTTAIRKYELKPFWSWCAVIRYRDRELLKENLLNCLLPVPMGLLLPIIFNHKVKLNRALLAGFLVSVVIELSQLSFKRGLFEWDDMIHNALGCMLGCWVMNWIFVKLKNRK